MLEPTTTLPASTTTTTLGGSVAAGQEIYDNECAGCHRAGSHDTDGGPDLAGHGDLIMNDMSGYASEMAGIMLTDQEVLDLAAFLDSL